jgi:hypothetical protein
MDVPRSISSVFEAAAAKSERASDDPPPEVTQTAGIPSFSVSIIVSSASLGESALKSNPINLFDFIGEPSHIQLKIILVTSMCILKLVSRPQR